MGVYIDMEMPEKTYAHCMLIKDLDGSVQLHVCTKNSEEISEWEYFDLVPVPPHGIIDREQILDAIRLELAQANAVNDMDDYDEWMRIFDYVRKFPTIIPAKEGEQ